MHYRRILGETYVSLASLDEFIRSMESELQTSKAVNDRDRIVARVILDAFKDVIRNGATAKFHTDPALLNLLDSIR